MRIVTFLVIVMRSVNSITTTIKLLSNSDNYNIEEKPISINSNYLDHTEYSINQKIEVTRRIFWYYNIQFYIHITKHYCYNTIKKLILHDEFYAITFLKAFILYRFTHVVVLYVAAVIAQFHVPKKKQLWLLCRRRYCVVHVMTI